MEIRDKIQRVKKSSSNCQCHEDWGYLCKGRRGRQTTTETRLRPSSLLAPEFTSLLAITQLKVPDIQSG